MHRSGLRDNQWERIPDVLPGRLGHVGVPTRDNRQRRPQVDHGVRSWAQCVSRAFP